MNLCQFIRGVLSYTVDDLAAHLGHWLSAATSGWTFVCMIARIAGAVWTIRKTAGWTLRDLCAAPLEYGRLS
jgi:hypothetical protein